MNDAEFIVAVRGIRKLIVTLDSIGFPIKDLLSDPDAEKIIPKDLNKRISSMAAEIHKLLQDIEHSKKYKDTIYKICNVSERRTFHLVGEEDG